MWKGTVPRWSFPLRVLIKISLFSKRVKAKRAPWRECDLFSALIFFAMAYLWTAKFFYRKKRFTEVCESVLSVSRPWLWTCVSSTWCYCLCLCGCVCVCTCVWEREKGPSTCLGVSLTWAGFRSMYGDPLCSPSLLLLLCCTLMSVPWLALRWIHQKANIWSFILWTLFESSVIYLVWFAKLLLCHRPQWTLCM